MMVIAAENLDRNDLIGTWHSYWSVIENEINVLTINEDFSSRFVRATTDAPDSLEYSWTSPEILFVDDVAIIEYRDDERLIYKLILAGWQTRSTRRVFGQMYMYRDGHLFNGLPIALETSIESEE